MIVVQLDFSYKGGGDAVGRQLEKAKQRLLSVPADYTYSEAKRLLCSLGFQEYHKGKTSGSRVAFYRAEELGGGVIQLHKPHPGDEMKRYAVRDLVEQLKVMGDLT